MTDFPSKTGGVNLPAGAPESAEIEVTPEMLRVGVAVLAGHHPRSISEEVIARVFRAMLAAREPTFDWKSAFIELLGGAESMVEAGERAVRRARERLDSC